MVKMYKKYNIKFTILMVTTFVFFRTFLVVNVVVLIVIITLDVFLEFFRAVVEKKFGQHLAFRRTDGHVGSKFCLCVRSNLLRPWTLGPWSLVV